MSGQLSKLYLEDELPVLLITPLADIIKKEGYLTFKLHSRRISTAGKNYLGELYEVDINGKTAEGPKVVNLFIKKFFPECTLKIVNISDIYRNECLVYKELIQIYAELQEEANVPADQRFRTVKCYHASSEAIILENLTPRGFRTHPRHVMSLQYAERAIQELAKFHSLSFVVQKLRPDYYRNTLSKMEWPCKWDQFDSCGTDLMNKTVDHIDDEETRKRFMSIIPYVLKRYRKLFDKKFNVVNVLCHSDFNPNNILIRSENGCLKELMIVDYQLIDYGCPLRDFFLLMYSPTSDRQFREQYLSHLKACYYEAMKSFLRHFTIDIEDVFPSEIYENQFSKARECGLSKELIFSSFAYATETEYLDIGNKEIQGQTVKMVGIFQNMIREYVDEFLEYVYMPSVSDMKISASEQCKS